MIEGDVYSQASQLVQSGEIERAKLLVPDPNDPRSRVIEAHILFNDRKYNESKAVARSIVSDPSVPVFDKLMAYYWYAWNHLVTGEYEKALEIVDQGLELIKGKEDEFKRGIAYLYNVKGTVMKETGKIDLGQKYTAEGLELAKRSNDKRLVCSMTNNLASIFFFRGEYKTALDLFMEAQKVARTSHNPYIESIAATNIGEIYYYLGDLVTADEYIRKSLDLNIGLDHKSGIATNYRKLGEIAFRQQNLNAAQKYLNKSIAIFKEVQNRFSLGFGLFSLIKVKLALGEDTEELQTEIDILAKDTKNQVLIQVNNLVQAIILKKENSLLQRGYAMIYLEKIIEDKVILFETTYEATIHYIELMIQEYILTEDREKLTKIINMVEEIYEQAQKKNASIKVIESLILKSKLQAISLEISSAIESLNEARSISDNNNLEEFTKRIDRELLQRHEELNRYQKIIDANSSLLDKIQHSGIVDYVKSLIHVYEK